MKQTPLILSIIALVAVAALGIIQLTSNGTTKKKAAAGETVEVTAKEGSIVWFDLDRVISEYDMANEKGSAIQAKGASLQEELSRRQNKIQADANKLQSDYEKGILISSVAQQKQQRIQADANAFNNYANQKQQEFAEESQVTTNQIMDAIKTYVDKFNEEHKFSMIIATSGGVFPQPVVTADPALDVTDAIIEGLNKEYVEAKKNGTEPVAAPAPAETTDEAATEKK